MTAEASQAAGITDPDVAAVQRRTLRVVMLSQVLGGAGLAAGVTVGALLAQDMLNSEGLAGLPIALLTAGSALAAFLLGRITARHGRRFALGAGFLAGGLGAIGVVLAAVTGSVVLLFVSLVVYGSGTATNLQARYAGTDLANPKQRGTAISMAMVATTFGAVAGPNLVEPLGDLARALGIPPLAGPFLLGAVAYLSAGLTLLALLRPDPYVMAQRLAGNTAAKVEKTGTAINPGVWAGAATMLLTQTIMVAIMTVTPVHMRAHHHALGAVGLVIGFHIGAMYLPSLVTGRLVDKVGHLHMAAAAGVVMVLAGVVAAVVPGDSLAWMIVALMLLGLGWNIGLIAGTALIVDATTPAERAGTQASIDVLIAITGAGGGVGSAALMSATSFATLSLVGCALAVALLGIMLVIGPRVQRRG